MENEWLADQFEAHRAHLLRIAYRMLGVPDDAEDAVQETWLRLSRTDTDSIDNLGGWLTTVVARVSLDMLRARRRKDAVAEHSSDIDEVAASPEAEAVLADSVGSALLVVLDALSPSERLAFVLHDMFAVPFEEVAGVLGRSTDATKMLASRARHKVQGGQPGQPGPCVDPLRQRQVVDAFLAASRNGDFDALVAVLHPEVVLDADAAAVRMGTPTHLRGAGEVANIFVGRALAAQPALIDGAVGIVWAVGGRPQVVWEVVIEDDRIVHIDMLAATDTLGGMDLRVLND